MKEIKFMCYTEIEHTSQQGSVTTIRRYESSATMRLNGLSRDPTPLLEIRNRIPDRIIHRSDLDSQNPFPLLRVIDDTKFHVRGVVVLDARLDALNPERSRGSLCGLDELLIREGSGGDENSFIGRFLLLESRHVGCGDVSDVDPVTGKIKFLITEDWSEEQVEPSLRRRVEVFRFIDLV